MKAILEFFIAKDVATKLGISVENITNVSVITDVYDASLKTESKFYKLFLVTVAGEVNTTYVGKCLNNAEVTLINPLYSGKNSGLLNACLMKMDVFYVEEGSIYYCSFNHKVEGDVLTVGTRFFNVSINTKTQEIVEKEIYNNVEHFKKSLDETVKLMDRILGEETKFDYSDS